MLIAISSKLLAPHVSLPMEDIDARLEIPRKPELWRCRIPLFYVIEDVEQGPPLIAAELAHAVTERRFTRRVTSPPLFIAIES